jgi:O-antigen/teichoic acid export membrane protein
MPPVLFSPPLLPPALKTRLKSVGAYFVASIVGACVSFFSIPLIISHIGQGEFGRWSLLEPVQLVFSQLMLLGVNYGIIKQINLDKLPPAEIYKSLFRSSNLIFIPFLILSILLLRAMSFSWNETLTITVLIYLEAALILILSTFRAANWANCFLICFTMKNVLFFIVLLFSVLQTKDVYGTLSDIINWRFVAALSGVLVGYFFISRKKEEFIINSNFDDKKIYIDAISYGMPMLITNILTMIIGFSDRYVLKMFFDYATLGNYVVYIKISSVINPLIIAPFGLWWPTERFKRIDSQDGGLPFFKKVSLVMLFVFLVAGGILWFFSPWLMGWFAPGVAFDKFIVLLLIYAVVFMGMATSLNIGLLSPGKTHLNIYVVAIGATSNIVLCFILIPVFGMIGAATATMLSYFIYALFFNIMSQRVIKIKHYYSQMFCLLVVSIVLTVSVDSYIKYTSFYWCLIKSIIYLTIMLCIMIFIRNKTFNKKT